MSNFHIKSLLLGIGIGIVLTSVISMVYSFGMQPMQSLSDKEIKDRARQMGMIESTQLIKSTDSAKPDSKH